MWSIQVSQWQYRDHLVGQLTTTYHDAPHLFIVIWGQKSVWILTDNNMHPSSLYYLGSACLNTLWAQSGWMGANNRTPIKGKWHLNWSLLTDRRQMIIGKCHLLLIFVVNNWCDDCLWFWHLYQRNDIFYWSLVWSMEDKWFWHLDKGIPWLGNPQRNFNTAHF